MFLLGFLSRYVNRHKLIHFLLGQTHFTLCQIANHILDRHHAWRSLDSTLAISSTFVKKKKSIPPPFFLLHHFLLKKTQLFIKMHIFFCIWLSTRLSAQLSARLSAGLSARLSARLSTRLSAQLSKDIQTIYLFIINNNNVLFDFKFNDFLIYI